MKIETKRLSLIVGEVYGDALRNIELEVVRVTDKAITFKTRKGLELWMWITFRGAVAEKRIVVLKSKKGVSA